VGKTISHTTSIRVRYVDTDKMGVVYHGVYLSYFEVARTEMLRAAGIPYSRLEETGILMPVLEASARYLQPARYDDVLDLKATYCTDHGAVMHIDYVITKGQQVLVTGFTKHTFVNSETWQPVRPPRHFREIVQAAAEDNV